MNPELLRPGNIAAAALVIAGALGLAVPQHVLSIARVVLVTVAAAAGLYALGSSAPATWWASPFDRSSDPDRGAHGSRDIERIRTELSGWRQRVPNGPPLPPEVLRLLRPLVEVALERAGLDAGGRTAPAPGLPRYRRWQGPP